MGFLIGTLTMAGKDSDSKERRRNGLQAQVAITNLGSRRLGIPLSLITGEEKAMWEALEVGLHHGFQYIDGTSIFAWTLLPSQCSILI